MGLIINGATVTKIECGGAEVVKIEDQNGSVLYEGGTDYLCFTANSAGSTISMSHYGTNQTTTKPTVYISPNKGLWTEWDFTAITLQNVGDRVYMWGDNASGISSSGSNYSTFAVSGSVSASGDVTTLVERGGTSDLSAAPYCFAKLFSGCLSLMAAPLLPATTLSSYCYFEMFRNCGNLRSAPVLPATTMADACYYSMFHGCTGLTTAPELPATTLAASCYIGMFQGCVVLADVPALRASTLADYCYTGMFYGCQSLSSITCLATDISAQSCLTNWVYGVAASGTFTKDAGMASWGTGVDGIPSGWTVADYVNNA